MTHLLFFAAQLLFVSEPQAAAVVATAGEGGFVAAFEALKVSLQQSSIYPGLLVAFFAHRFSFALLRLQVVSIIQQELLVFFVQREHLVFFIQQ